MMTRLYLLVFVFSSFWRAQAEVCGDLQCAIFLIGNGDCDARCLTAGCRYDNGDCCDEKVCPKSKRHDGNCDEECDSAACGFDFGDCPINRDEDMVLSSMSFILVAVGVGLFVVGMVIVAIVEQCRSQHRTPPVHQEKFDEEKGNHLAGTNVSV